MLIEPVTRAVTTIPVMGMFRSGTNFARTLLETNYDCTIVYNHFGWKHGFFPTITRDSAVAYPDLRGLFVSKGPFHQLLSLRRYAYDNGNNLRVAADPELFFAQPIVVHDSGRRDGPEMWFPSPTHYYNAMCWNLASLCAPPAERLIHLDFHALEAAPEEATARVAAQFGLVRLPGPFIVPVNRTRNMADRQDGAARRAGGIAAYTTGARHRRQGLAEVRAALGPAACATIAAELDRGLLERLGYAHHLAD